MPKLVRAGRDEGLVERVKQTIGQAPSVSWLASEIDRSEGAIRKWQRGEGEPNATDLKHLCQKTGVRVHWLVTGEGEMLVKDANFVLENGEEFYKKGYVQHVAQALNRQIKHRNGVITADQHAGVLVALLFIFKNSTESEPAAIDMLLDHAIGSQVKASS